MEHIIIVITFCYVRMSMIAQNIVRSLTLHKIHLQFTFEYISMYHEEKNVTFPKSWVLSRYCIGAMRMNGWMNGRQRENERMIKWNGKYRSELGSIAEKTKRRRRSGIVYCTLYTIYVRYTMMKRNNLNG